MRMRAVRPSRSHTLRSSRVSPAISIPEGSGNDASFAAIRGAVLTMVPLQLHNSESASSACQGEIVTQLPRHGTRHLRTHMLTVMLDGEHIAVEVRHPLASFQSQL